MLCNDIIQQLNNRIVPIEFTGKSRFFPLSIMEEVMKANSMNVPY